jgi:hypothetical protein
MEERAMSALHDRVATDWRAICTVLTRARGEGFEDELPDDLELGFVEDAPSGVQVVFRLGPVDYLRTPDGTVAEYVWDEIDDGVRVHFFAPNGELLRTVDAPLPS